VDRIDKALLVLPLLPLADLLSTLFALGFGGEEVGILARLALEQYGVYGLILLAASASLIFFVSMKTVIYIKRLFVNEWELKSARHVLRIPIYWFFILEGVYVSTVVMNLLVPISPQLTQSIVLRAGLVAAYFACFSMFTMPHVKHPR